MSTLGTDAPGAAHPAERVACPDCGLIQRLPRLLGREVVECARCERVLSGRAAGRVDLPLALASCALLLLFPAAFAPLLSVSTLGAVREGWLSSGVYTLAHQGFPQLATLVFICAVALPFVYTGALIWVLGNLHFAREPARQRASLGRLYRWVLELRPWMMIEVFLIGGFVAYTRIDAVADVEVDVGGWCLLAATFALLLALTQVDDRTVWSALAPADDDSSPREQPAEGFMRTSVLARSGPLACTICDLIMPASAEGTPCPRCQARLQRRKPDAFRRTLALLLAGYLLYIPANLLPVLTLTQVGSIEHNTIMSGVFELIHNDLWPLAVIVFVASIVLPLMKLFGLTWMLIAIQLRTARWLHTRTRLFRTIDLIGRWSNIDVFMGSVLVSVLQFGALTSVRPGPGLVAFAAVVVITMFATLTFDARLMWDAARRTS
jgi:paraquat-inducible protein A